ncbi:Aste57867_17498 [Aphanomyces stellatus]|uniref:Aste57867_17498 protein n=1 Tax=Aphanomyces stellatus TaxID=120398 RepID=A0A485L7X7_9STRA|nr:hypothetical protein As57867_017438 [Aphanomyces stellatus]VFT94251.1 Aste57867_17498 [Aphanomyces stellatus]
MHWTPPAVSNPPRGVIQILNVVHAVLTKPASPGWIDTAICTFSRILKRREHVVYLRDHLTHLGKNKSRQLVDLRAAVERAFPLRDATTEKSPYT